MSSDVKVTFSFVFLFFSFPMFVGAVEEVCNKIEASRQVAECARYKKYQSDRRLNLSYTSILNRIEQQYEKAPLLAGQYVILLREAQREWIKLRDANCKLEAFEIESDTEAHQVTVNNCISRLSDERSDYLKRIAPGM